MRQADRDELQASTGHSDYLFVLERALEYSDADMAWTCVADGEPIAIFGAAPIFHGQTFWGCAWLLTADALDNHKREAWGHSVRFVQTMHTRYSALTNYVDDRNSVSQRWLLRLGFKPTLAVSRRGHPFTQFVSLRNPIYV